MDLIQGYISGSSSAQPSQGTNWSQDSDLSFHDVRHENSNEHSGENSESLNQASLDENQDYEKHKRKQNQLKRNSGKTYQTRKGKIIYKRKFKRLQQCRKECNIRITHEDQRRLFHSYWSKGSYTHRFNFINSHIKVKAKKRLRKRKNVNIRRLTVDYFLNDEANRTSVCKKCFLMTLGETNGFIRNVIDKCWENMDGHSACDQRGKSTPKNKSPESKIQEIKDHIQKFPAYESHYSRSHTSKKYLPAGSNMALMHRLYCEEVTNPLSLKIYRQEFSKTGLKFKNPHLDTCHKCDEFAALLKYETDEEVKRQIEINKLKHHMNAELAYKAKCQDKEFAAASDGSYAVFSFDLQQCLPTPLLQTSVAFYKRPLWVFNLTINCPTANTKCYMWHEAISRRGGNEIASCLCAHLKALEPTVKFVTLYSDSCPGQNKNKIIAGMFSAFLSNHPTLVHVDHKFMEPGHTHMECDSDHAIIEKAKKNYNTEIHHPEDWYHLVKTAKQTNPFDVVVMNQSNFYNFEKLFSTVFTMRTQNKKNEKFLWRNVKWVRYVNNQQGTILYKTSLSEEENFSTLNIKKRGKQNFNLKNHLSNCFNTLVPISKEKKKDLLDLINLIRPEARKFYEDLPSDDVQNIDPDIEDLQTTEPEESSQTQESSKAQESSQASLTQELLIQTQVKEVGDSARKPLAEITNQESNKRRSESRRQSERSSKKRIIDDDFIYF